jgi:hypothetical protein
MTFRKCTLRNALPIVAAFLLFAGIQPAEGWGQPTHRQINLEAVKLFLGQANGSEKFAWGPFSQKGLSEPLRGVGVTSSSLLASGFVSAEAALSAQSWIINGGDWADEPHLYASVRHFYDPLRLSGAAYLTDQSEGHGLYDSPATDARAWGLSHTDNPFSFFSALAAYKAALEVRDDLPLPSAISSVHFKTSVSLAPADHDDQRKLYLSRAYRALGESMHGTTPTPPMNRSRRPPSAIMSGVRRLLPLWIQGYVHSWQAPGENCRPPQNSFIVWPRLSTRRFTPWTPFTTGNQRFCRTTGRRDTRPPN